MHLIDAIPLEGRSRVAFVGAGGKTTAMFRLARQAEKRGIETIFCSATTHLAQNQLGLADRHLVVNAAADLNGMYKISLAGVILLTGPLGNDGRTDGLSPTLIAEVEKLAQFHQAALLVEADGARRKPLKAPASHEPPIPEWVDQVVVVAGMSGIGQPLSEEIVHRATLFGDLCELEIGKPISVDALARLLLSGEGGLQGIPVQARRMVLLNQCDTPALAAQAKTLAEKLLSGYGQVILSHLEPSSFVEVIAVHRRIAGVVLAAGGSVRMGQPKQLLDWDGKPFIRVVAQTALDSGLEPVLVVTGADQEEVEQALIDVPVILVQNPGWEEGQASSVRKAIEYFSLADIEVYGAVFMLVDQPQIPIALVQTLLDAYRASLIPIVAPLINDRRANPVLFDRAAFDALNNLTGDAGGRQVFSRFQVQYVPWLDDRAGLDVDTLEDYRRLMGSE